MQGIKILIKERLPIIANLILAFGLMYSAMAITENPMTFQALSLGVVALFIFVSELRFMDELKDVEKDIIANPDRPLPRKAVTEKEVSLLIIITGALLVVLAISSFFLTRVSGIFYSVAIVWLYLMYKEFFCGSWLSLKPIFYAITHQIVIFPLCLFAIALFSSEMALTIKGLSFGLLILSAFFTFEVGRKLDPSSHDILKTYLKVYGAKKVILIICVLQTMAIYAAINLGMLLWVLIPAILIFISLPKLISKPSDFKNIEGLISLNLIYIVWAPAIKYFVESL